MQNVSGYSQNFYLRKFMAPTKQKISQLNEIAESPLQETKSAQRKPAEPKVQEETTKQTTSATASTSNITSRAVIWDKNYLYEAYHSIYRKDFEESNKETKPNQIAKCSQRSVNNAKKIITDKDKGKEHLKDFTKMLVEELKAMNIYDDSVKKAIEYIENNFKWDIYFEKYPSSTANELERNYLIVLNTLLIPNSIASKFLVDDARSPLQETKSAQRKPAEPNVQEETTKQTTSGTASTNNITSRAVIRYKNYLYEAYWNLYKKDFEESNKETKPNQIAKCSQRSVNNAKKIITDKDKAKEHLKDFIEKFVEELKALNKYDDSVKKAIEYIENNFKWDKYFKKYPISTANELERNYLIVLNTLLIPNSIASDFLVDD